MATWEVTIHTAACDVEPCEETLGDPEDWGWYWNEWSNECKDDAIRQGWTEVDGLLICKADDTAHDEARGVWPDTRPKPGPGQLTLIPHWTQRTKWIST